MNFSAEALDELLRAAMDRARSSRAVPQSTYRLQFHAKFTFRDAVAIIPYLAGLGITHVYASPYLKATPGSMHGYDVIDHCHLNPELGTSDDFDAFLSALREHQMGHITDMVPNHAGIATNENVWWNDVLENGPASIYQGYFDINWAGSPQTNLQGRVLIPTLGSMYGEELEQGNLRLAFENGAFFIVYHDRRFPVSPRTHPAILQSESSPSPGTPGEGGGEGDFEHQSARSSKSPSPQPSPGVPGEGAMRELRSIVAACERLPDRCEGAAVAGERRRGVAEIKRRLAQLAGENQTIRDFIAERVRTINGIAGQPHSFDRLDKLLRDQCFRLAFWKTAPDEINYRRFFDINDLAALAIERLDVFAETHRLIFDLLAQNKIAGLRIDHPDGLYDPKTYFHRLQTDCVLAVARNAMASSPTLRDASWDELEPLLRTRLEQSLATSKSASKQPPLYVLAEKILAVDEELPETWPIDGTSGYEFLNMTNGLFVDAGSASAFDEIYRDWTGCTEQFADLVYRKKKMILDMNFGSELSMLANELKRIAERSRYAIDFSLHGLLAALKEVIACFPVYRSYIDSHGASAADSGYIEQAIQCASKCNPKTEPSIFKFIRDALLVDNATEVGGGELLARRHFAGKFQQLSSPVMAKGVEDTAFYIYNRLLSLNEVGGDPSRFGVSPLQLHAFLERRQRDWPYSMSTLSTHDTKRSEDVRARLSVLSEIPQEWKACLERWGVLNARHRTMVDGIPMPSRNDEYALYQTLLGAWPGDAKELGAFKDRVQAAMLKSMREAKVVTSWTDPHHEREKAVHDFIESILDESQAGEFLAEFRSFQRKISRAGAINSLSQTLIKLAAPGVPDTYQGTDIMDFSLVDPDNRRPVDFARRQRLLGELDPNESSASDFKIDIRELVRSNDFDAIKLHIHRTALKLRRQYGDLFTIGQYIPLKADGSKASHLFAFARIHEHRIAIVAVPRLTAGGANAPDEPLFGQRFWEDTHLKLPAIAHGREFRHMFTNSPAQSLKRDENHGWFASDLFAEYPVALFVTV